MAKGFGKFCRKVEGREHDTVSTKEETGPWLDGWYERVVEHARRYNLYCPSREDVLHSQSGIHPAWRNWLDREVGLRIKPASAVEALVSAEQERVNPPSEQQEGVQVIGTADGPFSVPAYNYGTGRWYDSSMAPSPSSSNTRSR